MLEDQQGPPNTNASVPPPQNVTPQFPPVNTPQNQAPVTPPEKTFPIKKLIIAAIILLLIVIAGGRGFFAYQKFFKKNQNQPTTQSEASSSALLNKNNREQAQNLTNTSLLGKTWNDCNASPNESDYLPPKIGEYVADDLGNNQPQGYSGKYNISPTDEKAKDFKSIEDFYKLSFGVTIKKGSTGADGDINAYWQAYSKYWGTDNLNKEFNGATLLNTSKENYFGNETMIASLKSTSGSTGKDTILTYLMSLVPSHNMLIQVVMEGSKENKTEIVNNYQKWFERACNPKPPSS